MTPLREDSSKSFKDRFHIPQLHGQRMVYMAGNSLGLQPKSVSEYIDQELSAWAQLGVNGHFDKKNPWLSYHEQFARPLALLTGAKEEEVIAMNSLTVNLHLLLTSFYRPTSKKFKILIEKELFPSDRYALSSHLRYHEHENGLIEVVTTDVARDHANDFISSIERHKDELALVFISGVNYLTGEAYDLASIAEAAKKNDIIIGVDLAHAIGNIPLQLHQWGIDFAVWCSYKYLNSGPGGVGGAFVHQKHLGQKAIPRFEGWWGHEESTRFQMNDEFLPAATAEAWQLSNAPVLSMAAHKASLDIFEEAGVEKVWKKNQELFAYLYNAINNMRNDRLQVLTPKENHGAQISVVLRGSDKGIIQTLEEKGIMADWRPHEGNGLIRMAPCGLYNSIEDVDRVVSVLKEVTT